jgi:hypothetical protein
MAKVSSANDWDEADLPPIEDLTPQTFQGLARRIRTTETFAEKVYRESEMDALWTLCDMALEAIEEAKRQSFRRNAPPVQVGAIPEAGLSALSALVFKAHDLNADGYYHEAAQTLLEAAELSASWS